MFWTVIFLFITSGASKTLFPREQFQQKFVRKLHAPFTIKVSARQHRLGYASGRREWAQVQTFRFPLQGGLDSAKAHFRVYTSCASAAAIENASRCDFDGHVRKCLMSPESDIRTKKSRTK